MSWQLAGDAQAMMVTKDNLSEQRTVLARVDADYQKEVQRMEALGIDINLIQGALESYDNFELDRMAVLSLFQKIGEALGDELRLDTIVVDRLNSAVVESTPGYVKEKAQVEARLFLSFPPDTELDLGIREINNLRSRLAGLMPDYEVSIARQVARPEYTQNIKGVAGRTAEEIAAEEDYIAELVVRGPKR